MSTCIFCDIVAGEQPSTRIYETSDVLAFMDIQPATQGHALVVPKRHSTDLLDAPAADLQALAVAVQRVAAAAVEGLGAEGVNVVQATGEAAFQTVFHLHFHVVPRYLGDSVVIFPRPADPRGIAECAERLRGALDGG